MRIERISKLVKPHPLPEKINVRYLSREEFLDYLDKGPASNCDPEDPEHRSQIETQKSNLKNIAEFEIGDKVEIKDENGEIFIGKVCGYKSVRISNTRSTFVIGILEKGKSRPTRISINPWDYSDSGNLIAGPHLFSTILMNKTTDEIYLTIKGIS